MATTTARKGRVPLWVAAVLPIALIAALVALFLAFNPIGNLRAVPPVEALAFERTVLEEGLIELHVRNDGPDPVTVAQVLVNDSYRSFTVSDGELGRLESAVLRVPYPWDDGLPLNIGIVTATGVVIEHEIEAAALTPEVNGSTLAVYALLGVYIGIVPVSVGLLWFGALRRAPRGWQAFVIAFTVGLLLFLLLDTIAEGLELASATAGALDGLGLFVMGALVAVGALTAAGSTVEQRSRAGRSGLVGGGLLLAYLIAAGIGLHNLGEGLAVGAALATGEVALGTFLVLGFAIHNTTEGLAIVAPMGASERRPALRHFVWLGVVAGAPAIVGAWAGGLAFSPAWAAFAFGVAAGAIAQVVWQIGRGPLARDGSRETGAWVLGLVGGYLFMYLTGLLTA
jgi:ZIP family zinc transporter